MRGDGVIRTPTESLADLLTVFDELGGWMSPQHQIVLQRARHALVREIESPMVILVCRVPLCPSRLVLPPGTTKKESAAIASMLRWSVLGDWHQCPGCHA
jgi:hypothetical protein